MSNYNNDDLVFKSDSLLKVHLNNEQVRKLIIAAKIKELKKNPNSDQYIEWNTSETMYNFITKNVDGGILTFNAIHPKWSYAKIDKNKNVIEVAEKKVISNNATVGVYYWKQGKDFVKYTNKMIEKNIRVNNEFYVCPVYH